MKDINEFYELFISIKFNPKVVCLECIMAVKKIKCIADLMKHLKDDAFENASSVWYRGHSVETWSLESGYERLKKPPKEIALVNEFRQNANFLLDKHTPGNDFEWLFLMQHYGVPTRLLDWSESPLVSLYFAVETDTKASKSKDGALWVLDPGKLNTNTNVRKESYIPSFEDGEYMDDFQTNKFDSGQSAGLMPIAAIATRNNARIQAQLGTFTISRSKIKIDEIGDKKHIRKYIIPKDSKALIAEELKLLGLNKFQIFPELSSIGEMIKRNCK
jgi:hypothetical protein